MGWLNSTYILNLLNPETVVNEVGIWLILAFFVVLGWVIRWVIRQIFKIRGYKKEKKIISERLLSEIWRNQKLLKPLSDSVVKVLDSNDELSEDEKLPNDLNFDRTIYLNSSDKLGLLNNICREKLEQYYSDLQLIENQYTKLELIHGNSYGFLRYLEFKELTVIKAQVTKPEWHEIKSFLKHTKEVYDLGTESITSLNEGIGIKSVGEEKGIIKKGHLRTSSPDLRKLWFDCKELKTQISKDKKIIIEYIEKKYGGLPPDFEWEPRPDKKKRPIYEMFEEFFQKAEISENGNIKDSKEFVETVMNDTSLYEILERIFKNEGELYEKKTKIEQRLEKIMPDFEEKIMPDFERRYNELKD